MSKKIFILGFVLLLLAGCMVFPTRLTIRTPVVETALQDVGESDDAFLERFSVWERKITRHRFFMGYLRTDTWFVRLETGQLFVILVFEHKKGLK